MILQEIRWQVLGNNVLQNAHIRRIISGGIVERFQFDCGAEPEDIWNGSRFSHVCRTILDDNGYCEGAGQR
jgi:hypothetical protein